MHHATHAGSMFRPENPLLPNYKWLPVAYHGRSSSIVASGSGVRRPFGQVRPGPDEEPVLRASRRLDYEAEIGFYVGAPTRDGEPVSVSDAGAHVFGFSLVNDWSARDIQAWEYQPLGPFLGKSFATTVSPWIVTTDALAPFRTRRVERAAEDPQPLAHLQSAEDASTGAYDIEIDVLLQTAAMRDAGLAPHRLSRGRFSDAYWTVAQMVAHHTSNGCGLRSGDLIGSGTISGEERSAWGSLLELSWNGTQPLSLPHGEQRTFLEDGDEVILRGSARRAGFATIGFGECRGQIHGR